MAETLAAEYGPREQELRELLDATNNRFFWCNTDREHSVLTKSGYDLERTMHNRNYAVAWEEFKEPSNMKRVKCGDAIFLFAKGGVGIVGIGRAKAEVQVLQPGDPDRLGTSDNTRPLVEWGIPLDWLDWRRDRDAFRPKTPLRQTYLEVTKDRALRNAVREHFLGRT